MGQTRLIFWGNLLLEVSWMLRLFRTVHLWLGVFISPALLFFAFTGALQTFSLHETTQGSSYKPPAWIVTLAQIHKKQTDVVPVRRSRPDAGPGASAAGKPADGAAKLGVPVALTTPETQVKPKSHMALKIFFLIVSIGLFTSTLTGIYMSYKYNRNKWAVTLVLAAGVVLPLVLLAF